MMGTGESVDTVNSSYTPWLIALIVVASVVIVVVVLYLFLGRSRDQQFEAACNKDPYLTRKEYQRRKKMSPIDRLEEEELQRHLMIRKSLATRSSRANSEVTVSITMVDDETAPSRLRDDWKHWEARLQRERSASGERHPFGDGSDTESIRDLSLPPRSRGLSLSNSPLLSGQVTPPLPSPPMFAHLNDDRRTSTPPGPELRPAHIYRG